MIIILTVMMVACDEVLDELGWSDDSSSDNSSDDDSSDVDDSTDCSTLGHIWTAATCTTPKTCSVCGATEGSALEHRWASPTCTEPKTCRSCGTTKGSPRGHNWYDANCYNPKTCAVCGLTEGSPIEHTWTAATCTAPKTCYACGDTEGSALGHTWTDATCTVLKTCSVCKATEGTTLAHTESDWYVETPATFIEDGLKCTKCTACGTRINEEIIPATGTLTLAYNVNEDGLTATITGIGSCTDTVISIPAVIDGYTVTAIDAYAFRDNSTVTSVIINHNNLISIGNGAFSYCSKLATVNIPDSVNSIGKEAFFGCYSLVSISLGNGLTAIQDQTFAHCSSLTDITVPDSVISIGDYAFNRCTSLASVAIGSGVAAIGTNAFGSCASLTSLTVDESNSHYSSEDSVLYTKDGQTLIYYCAGKTDALFTVPNGVKHIKGYAFSYAFNLYEVTIPLSVDTIDDFAFYYCASLATVNYFGSENEWNAISKGYGWVSDSGDYVLVFDHFIPVDSEGLSFTLNEDGTGYIVTGMGSCCDTYICIPATYEGLPVVAIGERAFYDRDDIISVFIPSGVTYIGVEAFYDCAYLETVTISDTVTSIEANAFFGCGIKNIRVASNSQYYKTVNGVLYTKDGKTLVKYPSLKTDTSFTVPAGVTSIGDYAFSYGINLTDVILPDSVTSFGYAAFGLCINLVNVNIPESLTYIGDVAFVYCIYLTDITLPDGITSIGSGAFGYCASFTSITIPEGITSIGDETFSYCANLASITLPEGITSIGEDAFSNCTNLASINLPDSLTSIGSTAFEYCSSLTYIVIPNSVTFFGNGVFAYSALESIVFPDTLTYIAGGMFSHCGCLESIVIPENVTYIDDYAFYECNSLTSITIPVSVTSIGDRTFNYCTSLTTINYAGTEAEWNAITKYNTWDYYTGDYTVVYNYVEHTHSYSAVVTEPTFTEHGYTTYTCECGDSYVTDYTPTLSGASAGLEYELNNDETGYILTGIGECTDTNVIIPSTHEGLPVVAIGDRALHSCSSFTSISIPDSITYIGEDAFAYCTSLVRITIPESVVFIGKSPFFRCSSLISIDVDRNNSYYMSIDGNLYSKDGKTLIQYAIGKTDVSFIVPDDVTVIERAFSGCNLASITIHDNVTSIARFTFSHCSNLVSINVDEDNSYYMSIDGNLYSKDGKTLIQYAIGKSNSYFTISDDVTTIGEGAFAVCENLISVIIPNSITCIDDYAFQECISLESIIIPDSVEYIGYCSFYYCSSLETVTIPVSVTLISDSAFSGCTSLATINYKGTEEEWNAIQGPWSNTGDYTVVYNYTEN